MRKITVGYRYIEDDIVPIMYYPMQRMGMEVDEPITDYSIKQAIVKKLDMMDMNIDKIRHLEWWEDNSNAEEEGK